MKTLVVVNGIVDLLSDCGLTGNCITNASAIGAFVGATSKLIIFYITSKLCNTFNANTSGANNVAGDMKIKTRSMTP